MTHDITELRAALRRDEIELFNLRAENEKLRTELAEVRVSIADWQAWFLNPSMRAELAAARAKLAALAEAAAEALQIPFGDADQPRMDALGAAIAEARKP